MAVKQVILLLKKHYVDAGTDQTICDGGQATLTALASTIIIQ